MSKNKLELVLEISFLASYWAFIVIGVIAGTSFAFYDGFTFASILLILANLIFLWISYDWSRLFIRDLFPNSEDTAEVE